jgi:hypothetical protein
LDLEVKGQGSTKVITVCDTPPYGHAPTYQISLTYLERQKCYGLDKKILFKNNYLTLRSKVKVPRMSLWYVTHHLMVMHPHTKYNWPIWKDKKVMVRTSFAKKKQKRKKKRKKKSDKQYVSLHSKGRHNYHMVPALVDPYLVQRKYFNPIFSWLYPFWPHG